MLRYPGIAGITVVMLAGFSFTAHPGGRSQFERWQHETFELVDVSLPASFKLTAPDRIEEFNCLVEGGVVERIYTPYQWDVTIDNSSEAVGARTEVKANAAVGAAEFDDAGLQYFHDFITIAWLKKQDYRNVVVELTVDTMDAHSKKVKFRTQQLVLKPVNRPARPF